MSLDGISAYEQWKAWQRKIMGKQDKKSVDYSLGMRNSHCGKTFSDDKGYCKHFVPHRNDHEALPGTCTKVDGGISRVYWCKLFEKAE